MSIAVVTGSGTLQDGADEEQLGRANWLRAGVLGANDGVVSVAAIVVGVAGATAGVTAVVVAGLAALIGGAVSMALGEYVSVSSQRDLERAARRGRAASEQANPWTAAGASAVSFLSGGVLPLLAMVLSPGAVRIPATVLTVLIVLAVAGAAAARLGHVQPLRPTIRTILGGGLALALTYVIGGFFHVNGITA